MSNIKPFITFFLITILFSGCQLPSGKHNPPDLNKTSNPQISKEAQTLPGAQKEINFPSLKECVCVQLWMPVCGENGKTYSNACFAQCAKVNYTQGACPNVIKD